MKGSIASLLVFTAVSVASAAETLFTAGPQEFGGQKYYWLAEWKLEVTLPDGMAPDARFEVLFGTKGPDKRTLHYQYDGRSGSLALVRKQPFEWVEIPLGKLAGGKLVVLSGKGRERVAFLAGVRVTGTSAAELKVKPTRVAVLSSPTPTGQTASWSDLPGFELNDEARRLWDPSPQKPDWARAERSSQYAGIALGKVQRWLHEACLAVRDEKSGLFRPTGAEWNYRDTAADCYPFYVWAAYYTDKEVLDTVMIDALEAEQRLCNHLDRLPVSYDMDQGRKIEMDFDSMVFGASEYAKDGLVPIVEITGKDYPWFERMRGIVDDVFKHARYETPYGPIPSTNVEVNGDLMQILPRLYCMTGEAKYLDWAHRMADCYLLPGGFVPSHLSDHGCEIIGGLGLLFAVDHAARPDKCDQYKPHMEHMFDEILRRGSSSACSRRRPGRTTTSSRATAGGTTSSATSITTWPWARTATTSRSAGRWATCSSPATRTSTGTTAPATTWPTRSRAGCICCAASPCPRRSSGPTARSPRCWSTTSIRTGSGAFTSWRPTRSARC
jgi:hypothetical protein